MTIKDHENYESKDLQPFVESVLDVHYNTIKELCISAKRQTTKLKVLETHGVTSQYILLCESIIAETQQYIGMRKERYIPYILKLSEKAAASHDCSNCTGNCKLNHDVHLLEIQASNDLMKKMLGKLQMATLPLYSDTIYPEEYRVLRNQMALIETNLTELFFLENNYLIPKITEAQKSINAGS